MGEFIYSDGRDVGVAGEDECEEAMCGDEGESERPHRSAWTAST